MKRILALVLMSVLLLSFAPVFGAESNQIEISFRVGDDTLSINGNYVKVEKPFIKGEGTTLVPIRVITEAFGALVEWEGTEKKITLTYPDVSIVLQIDNRIAVVNDHTETLLEAPVLQNDTTMVPLRFISETFGAQVTYDDATKAITVTKQLIDGSVIQNSSNQSMIGDSYFGWTMGNLPDFVMTDRSFDGTYTLLEPSSDEGVYYEIEYSLTPEDLTFDELFAELKQSTDGITLIKADKLTDKAGNRYINISGKTDESQDDLKVWLYKEYFISLFTSVPLSIDSAKQTKYFNLSDTFSVQGTFDDNVYDLSDVENGYRLFESKDYKLSFKVPATYFRDESLTGGNEMVFINYTNDDLIESIHAAIFSKSATVTSKILADSDRNVHYEYANKEIVAVSEVTPCKISGLDAYYYTKITNDSSDKYTSMKDVFFELGDYVYNITVVAYADRFADVEKAVFDSVKAEELDSQTIGSLLRNDPEDIDRTIKGNDWKIQHGPDWDGYFDEEADICYLYNRSAKSIVTIAGLYVNDKSFSAKQVLEDYIEGSKISKKSTVVAGIKQERINNDIYYKAVITFDMDGETCYETIYGKYENNYFTIFSLMDSIEYYNGKSMTEFKKMIESFTMID